jgi:hypothetical protein
MKALFGWAMIAVLAVGLSAGARDEAGSWQVVESKYFRIYHQSPADLARLTSHLYKGESREAAQRIKKTGVVEPQDLWIYDRLYEQTMNLLGMRSSEKKTIRIYPSYTALSVAYERIANQRQAIIAFYDPRWNAICVDSSADRSVLAHEMAHAVADTILAPNSPREIQEFLASYVQNRI